MLRGHAVAELGDAAQPSARISAALASQLKDPPMRRRIRCQFSEEILLAMTSCVCKLTRSAARAFNGTTTIMPESWARRHTSPRIFSIAASPSRHSLATADEASGDRRQACLGPTFALWGSVSWVKITSRLLPDLDRNTCDLSATRCALAMASKCRLWATSREPQAAITVEMAKSALGLAARASRPAPLPVGAPDATKALATVASAVAYAQSPFASTATFSPKHRKGTIPGDECALQRGQEMSALLSATRTRRLA